MTYFVSKSACCDIECIITSSLHSSVSDTAYFIKIEIQSYYCIVLCQCVNPVSIETSIFQERWQSVEAYLVHLATVEEQYLSFLDGIVVRKLNIIGTEDAVTNATVRRIFERFHPKCTVLDVEKRP